MDTGFGVIERHGAAGESSGISAQVGRSDVAQCHPGIGGESLDATYLPLSSLESATGFLEHLDEQ